MPLPLTAAQRSRPSPSGVIVNVRTPSGFPVTRNFPPRKPEDLDPGYQGEDGIILMMYLSSEPQSEIMEVTLKLHAPSMSRIVSSLERFKYKVKASYQESDYSETLKDNYDALMHYLNV